MAKLAQVSPVVVSRVLHNKANGVRVSEATSVRVREAAVQLNYRVNIWARNFRNQKTAMIGVLNGMGMDRPRFNNGPRNFSTLMDGIVEGAFQHKYSVALCPQLLGDDPQEAVNDGRFDGLVWYSITPSECNLNILNNSTTPIVIIHARSAEYGGKHPTVICDNAQGIGLAVEHLVKGGHRRIAFATEGDALNVESEARLKAFWYHTKRRGIDVKDRDILDIRRDREALHAYLKEGPRHTAVIVHADGLAGDFIVAAPKYGVRIPEDLSIIGFDSTEYCDQLRPALTSISQPLFDMGARAVDLLMRSISEQAPDSMELILPCGLNIRGSTTSITSEVLP